MGMSQINPSEEKEKKPSALENFAKVLGIGVDLGNLGINAYDTFGPKKPVSAPISGGNN